MPYKWKCTQTFYNFDNKRNRMVTTKEFYRFDGDKPIDRIFVDYVSSLDVNEKILISCLDNIINNRLTMCYIDNFGHTRIILKEIVYNGYGIQYNFGKTF